MSDYAYPEMLVSTDWVAEYGQGNGTRLVEVDVDTLAYEEGHLKGAVGINWTSQLCDHIRRDILTKEQFESLCSASGIDNKSTVVFYGDNNNWFACYALWQFRLYGHPEDQLRIMNGGRAKWVEEGRPLSQSIPRHPATSYRASDQDKSVRASKDEVFEALEQGSLNLVDTRSPAEYTGSVIAPAGMNETAQRGGHIPGAKSIPWTWTVNDDGIFKTRDELTSLYEAAGVNMDKGTVAYCRIGERSSHSWFVLKYLMGAKNVINYDGGWTEWGNLVGAPIEKDGN